MSPATFLGLAALVLLDTSAPAGAEAPKHRALSAVPFTDVKLQDEFWTPRIRTNREKSLPHNFTWCEQTGRISNFSKAAGSMPGKFEGIYFNDSDVYKVLEGASYSLADQRDPDLEKTVDEVIAKIAAAQEPDGYLYTARTLCGPASMPPGGKERWSDLGGGHELYCAGHLYEGAVAHFQATGKRTLLSVALENADLVCRVFGPDKRTSPDGHQEIEIGLVKLFRVTGEQKYLDLAKFFLDTRGRPRGRALYGEYSQDHKPVVEQSEAVGHAVRAGYMYSAMADVAALTGEGDYVQAISRIWQNVVGRKLYLTGGLGARGGIEGFGADYELPNRSAYCETCAAIANALWNHRMFLWTGDGQYVDVLERVLYNGFLSGVSMAGDRFFYPNPLEAHQGWNRSPWFDCACCPSNVVRFVPSIPGYAYALRDDTLFVSLFLDGRAAIRMGDRAIGLRQETRYPWDGAVRIALDMEPAGEFTLAVRIPGWACGRPVPSDLYRYVDSGRAPVSLQVNGSPVEPKVDQGFARLRRRWQKGDVVELRLPMGVNRVVAHEKVLDDAGRVAVERGPVVFCAEGHDQKDGRVLSLMLRDATPLRSEFRKDLLGGVQVVLGKAVSVGRDAQGTPVAGPEQDLTLIPYYAWAHRGPSPMAVWLARELAAAKPLPGPSIARSGRVTASGGTGLDAITDQLPPRNSIDHSNPFFHWWPRKGTQEWVQFDFARPEKISRVDVYWFDDTGIGECRLPKSWRVKVKVRGQWQDVAGPSAFGVEKDKFNRTTFAPVQAEGIRLEVRLPEQFSAGIHEVQIR